MLAAWVYFWDVSAGTGTSVDNWDNPFISQVSKPDFFYQNYQALQTIEDNPSLPPLLASIKDVTIMGYRGYSIPKALMLQSDDGVERVVSVVTITDFTWDNDSENQKLQADWIRDQIDERNNFPIIPIREIDNEAEQQFQWIAPFGQDDLLDTRVEFVVVPAWDNDSENQLIQLPFQYQFDKDVIDPGIEILPVIISAMDVALMSYKGYSIPKSLMIQSDDGEEKIVPAAIVGDFTWDDINEQSRQWLDSNKDHLLDEGTERIVIPVIAYDNAGDNQLAQLPYQLDEDVLDANVEILPSLFTVNDLTLVGYRGYAISKALMIQADDNVEKVILNPIVTSNTWDDINEQSRFLPENFRDHLIDEGVEKITLPPPQFFDTDGENQILQPSWNLDQIDERNQYPIIPIMEIDLDAEYQLLQPLWNLDQVEERNQYPIVPVVAYDNDAENQILQPLWNLDQVEERNEYPIIPIMRWDNDADQQFLNPLGFSSDSLADESVEKITLNPIVTSNTWDDINDNSRSLPENFRDHLIDEGVEKITIASQFYDTDADNQLSQLPYQLDTDVLDSGVEILPIVISAQDVVLMSYKGYSIPKALMLQSDDGVEKITLNPIVGDFTWDDINEQNRALPENFRDHLLDEGIEKIFIPVAAYDNDADEQLAQLPYLLDKDLLDTEVENLPLLFTVNDLTLVGYRGYSISKALMIQADDNIEKITLFDFTWDDINDNSRSLPENFRDHLLDDNVEKITLNPIVGDFTWDDINEQSRALPENFKDHLMDESIEKITLPTQFYDNDSDQQLSQLGYNLDRDVTDPSVENIIVPVFSINVLQDDSDGQIFQLAYQLDRDSMDTEVELILLPPFIDIVEIVAEEEQ